MLIISESARKDLKEVWAYVSGNDVSAAEHLIRELAAKFDLLEANPNLGRTRHEFILNLRSLPHKRYIIFYFPIQSGVEIYRIVHSSRELKTVFTDYFEGLYE